MKFLIVALILVSLNSCRQYTKEDNLKKGISIKDVQKFEKLFPNAYSDVGYLRGVGDDYIWMSTAALYQKYIINLSFPLESPHQMTKNGSVRIVVNEMYNDEENKGRVLERTLFQLNQSQWAKVKIVEDVFLQAGVKPEKKSPVEGFEKIPPENW